MQLKKYDLVIADSLRELIATTNIAIEYGYTPLGGYRQIEKDGKYLQTIVLTNKQITKNMQKFKVTELVDTRMEGSGLEVGKVYTGTLMANGNISYTDRAGVDWIFYPNDTCELINEKGTEEITKPIQVFETNFFQQLSQLMNDKQIVKFTITKVGENITLLVNKDNKLINMTGTPPEVDEAILSHLKVSPTETKELVINVTDAPKKDKEEEEEEEEEEGETSTEKNKKKKEARKGGNTAVQQEATKIKSDKKKADAPKPGKKSKYDLKIQVEKAIADKDLVKAQQIVTDANKGGGLPKLKVAELQKLIYNYKPDGDTASTEDKVQKCRVCGCTDDDCAQCVEKTGTACHWVEDDLCSACEVNNGAVIINPKSGEEGQPLVTPIQEIKKEKKVKPEKNTLPTSNTETIPEVKKEELAKVDNSEKFKELMGLGTHAMTDFALGDNKYEKSMEYYKQAMEIAPEGDKTAEEGFIKAQKWDTRLKEMMKD